MTMQDLTKMEGYEDARRKFAESLTLEERLAGLSLEQCLAGLAPEQRLAGLAPEQRLAGLAPEQAEEAARAIDAVLGKGAVAGDDAEKLSTQLDQLRTTLEDSTIKPVVAERGGPKAAADLKTQASILREASQTTAAPRGTPQETEQLDLLDGIILSLVRSAREAADAASKALGEPALVAEFELTELYGIAKTKANASEETIAPGAPGAPGHTVDPATSPTSALPGNGAE
jgi:hypothetical protein